MTPSTSADGCVLSGGGAFGAYEAGVVKALLELGKMDPIVYSGTSVGAYSAAILCQGGGGTAAAANLEKLWLHDIAETAAGANGVYRIRLNPFEFFDPRTWMANPLTPMRDFATDAIHFLRLGARKARDFAVSNEPIGRRTLDLVDVSSLLSTAPFDRLVSRTVDVDAIRSSPVQLRVTATRWDRSGVNVEPAVAWTNADMTSENGHLIILASAAIPVVFPPQTIGQEWFVDGGLAANTPMQPAVHAGAKALHVVDLDADEPAFSIDDLDSSYEALVRSANIIITSGIRREMERVEQFNRTLREEDQASRLVIHRYHPKTPLGGYYQLLDFRRGFLEELIQRGYEDAKSHDCDRSRCVR